MGRLDDQVVILKQDFERQVLPLGRRILRGRDGNLINLARFGSCGGICSRLAAPGDMAFQHQGLQAGARQLWHKHGQGLVEAFPAQGFWDGHEICLFFSARHNILALVSFLNLGQDSAMPSEKTLKRIVIILGILLVTGFFGIAGTIIYRSVNPVQEVEVASDVYEAVSSPSVSFPTPKGAELIGISHNMAVTIVHIKNKQGVEQKLAYDSRTGEFLGELVVEKP